MDEELAESLEEAAGRGVNDTPLTATLFQRVVSVLRAGAAVLPSFGRAVPRGPTPELQLAAARANVS